MILSKVGNFSDLTLCCSKQSLFDFLLRIIYHIPNLKNYNNVITDYTEEGGGHPSFDSNHKSVVTGKRLIISRYYYIIQLP